MKKFQASFWTAIIVTLCVVSLAWAAADNRRPFLHANVTIVKIVDRQVTVRNVQGRLLVFEISRELRARQALRNFKPGDKVRIQVQGNLLTQVQR